MSNYHGLIPNFDPFIIHSVFIFVIRMTRRTASFRQTIINHKIAMKTTNRICKMLFLLTLLLGCGAAGRATSWEPTINQVVWKGDVKRLILLVETPDRPFYTPNAREEYDRMLNGENYTGLGCVGSARDFLIDNSGGKFRPQFIVAGPLRLSKSMGY
ncbi:MAG: hypothetical protein U0N09_05935, partial [Alistipes dispar]